jgi:hypothetical protein
MIASTQTCGGRVARAAKQVSWFVAIGLLVTSSLCAAQADEDMFRTDPAFAGGQIAEDAYGSNLNGNNLSSARAVARFPNGDIVVASLVRTPNGNQVNGHFNIGLARYDTAGNPVIWSNPRAEQAYTGGRYVVFPNSNEADYTNVRAVSIIDDKIVVLAERVFGAADYDTHVVVYRDTGFQLAQHDVFTNGSNEIPADIATYSGTSIEQEQLVVTAVDFTSNGATGLFQRFRIEDGGTLTQMTPRTTLDVAGCRPSFDCRPQRMARAFRGLTGDPLFYIAAQVFEPGSADERVAVLKVGKDGATAPGWNINGSSFNLRSGGGEYPVGIDVQTSGIGLPNIPYRDTVYVASAIERECSPGTAVFKMVDSDSVLVPVTRFGGGDRNALGTCIDNGSDTPRALALEGGRLAVVGYNQYRALVGSETFYSNTLAVLDTDLVLRHFENYSFPIGGPLQRNSVLLDVVASGNGTFTAVGEVAYRDVASVPETLRGKIETSRVRFQAVRMFADGFE